jgi:hypothetical protein
VERTELEPVSWAEIGRKGPVFGADAEITAAEQHRRELGHTIERQRVPPSQANLQRRASGQVKAG